MLRGRRSIRSSFFIVVVLELADVVIGFLVRFVDNGCLYVVCSLVRGLMGINK